MILSEFTPEDIDRAQELSEEMQREQEMMCEKCRDYLREPENNKCANCLS